jgi:exonuclease III
VCLLNISKPGKKTHAKLLTVTKNGSEIIFLCDVRLNSDIQIAGVNDIEKKCRFLGYTLYHNSHLNSRGTAILISNKVKYTIVDSFNDDNCNMLLLKVKISNVTITIGSIYGPNIDDETFYLQLKEQINNFNSDYVVVGGDWNATLDSSNSRINIDTFNTAGIPSVRRSIWLNKLCDENNLLDPYRYFYPDTREFTFVPFSENATNRSRLDFFLISKTLTSQCINCRIPNYLSSLLFDHKQVTLFFRRDNPYKKQIINDTILRDSDLTEVVNLATIECYINNLVPTDTLSDIEIERYRTIIGQILACQKELVECRIRLSASGFNEVDNGALLILRNSIKNNLDLLPYRAITIAGNLL